MHNTLQIGCPTNELSTWGFRRGNTNLVLWNTFRNALYMNMIEFVVLKRKFSCQTGDEMSCRIRVSTESDTQIAMDPGYTIGDRGFQRCQWNLNVDEIESNLVTNMKRWVDVSKVSIRIHSGAILQQHRLSTFPSTLHEPTRQKILDH